MTSSGEPTLFLIRPSSTSSTRSSRRAPISTCPTAATSRRPSPTPRCADGDQGRGSLVALPVWPAEDPAKDVMHRVAAILEGIHVIHRTAVRRRELSGLIVADGARDVAAGDRLDPVRVNEPQALRRVDHDAVEQVKLGHLEDVL